MSRTDSPRACSLRLRPAAERFHSQRDWLDSRHTFSFASHHDPAWMGHDPLRVINDDTIAAAGGFGMHPHRDMEIITVMVEGALRHRDSLGHSEELRAGEVQRMTAGIGVVHSESNDGEIPCRLLQIWIEPERCGLAPSYEQKPVAIRAGWTPLLHPERCDGAMAIARPAWLWRARPAAGDALPLPPLPALVGWIQMIEGSGLLTTSGGDRLVALQRGDGVGWGLDEVPLESARFTAGADGADLLLFCLQAAAQR